MAPDVSLTMPATAGCENAGVERTSSAAMTRDPATSTRMTPSICAGRSLRQAEAAINDDAGALRLLVPRSRHVEVDAFDQHLHALSISNAGGLRTVARKGPESPPDVRPP